MYFNNKGERLSRILPKWHWLEHTVRYNFAARFVKNKNVLDCACGSGVGSEIFLKSGCKSLIGVDFSLEAVNFAKNRCLNFSNGRFEIGDGCSLSVDNKAVDVFVSLETIEHIERDIYFLDEVKRVLNDKGVFICSTPNRFFLNPELKITDTPQNKFHVREYSTDEFETILKGKFCEVKIYGFNKISKKKKRLIDKIRKKIFKNNYLWLNLIKAHRILVDNIENYNIEEIDDNYEYEYLVAVCRI